jgi:hypothetical protein
MLIVYEEAGSVCSVKEKKGFGSGVFLANTRLCRSLIKVLAKVKGLRVGIIVHSSN